VDLLPYDEYARSLNRKRIAAGVLFRDDQRRVLLLETSYKAEWDIPGGSVEAGEAPWATARREVAEEIGLNRPLGRLLTIDYVPAVGVMPEGVAFVWDGGLVTEDDVKGLVLTDPEILSVRLCELSAIEALVKPALAGRIAASLDALDRGSVVFCEDGRQVY
jgi:8-oxo-dGTP pyrophosphatase MutT (NUDIX family)